MVTNRIRGAGAAAGASQQGWHLGLVMVLLPVLTAGLMAVSGLDRSHAVANGQDAQSPQGQVRVQDDLGFLGSGTLVASNWVLTARHVFEHPDDPRRHSIVFGTVDGTSGSSANVRVVEDIVPREGTDLALVRFAPEVTAGTYIPPLATQAPQRYEPAHVYGWGMPQNGSQPLRLRQGLGIVIDPAATANDAYNAEQSPLWRTLWPETPPPMVLGAAMETGDSGGGAFIDGRLAGVLVGEPQYHYFNQQGEVVDREFHPAWEIPVWGHLDWIRRTINGEGSSGSNAETPRRRLGEVPTVPSQDSPLLPPPPESVCGSSGGCSPPDPTWNLARLSGVQGAVDVPGQQVGRGWWLTTQDFLSTRITNASAC